MRMVSSASSVFSTEAKIQVPISTPGMEPTDSHHTSRQWTVLALACTSAPTGFIAAEATTSLETAAAGGRRRRVRASG
jgi:hypothetical protein